MHEDPASPPTSSDARRIAELTQALRKLLDLFRPVPGPRHKDTLFQSRPIRARDLEQYRRTAAGTPTAERQP